MVALAAGYSARPLAVDPGLNGGRLSVDSSDPLGQGTGQTLYFLPYKGNKISLWNPGTSKWETHEIPDAGLQMAHDATNLNGGGTISYSVPYDVVCYLSGGAPTLGPWSWESTADRDNPIVKADGVWSINGEKTYRVVGATLMIDSSGAKFTQTQKQIYVSNADNDVEVEDGWGTTGPANYNTATEGTPRRIANNSSVTAGALREVFRAEFLQGFPGRKTKSNFQTVVYPVSGSPWEGYMALDGAEQADPKFRAFIGATGIHLPAIMRRADTPDPGYHYYEAYEIPAGVATVALTNFARMEMSVFA